MRARVKKPHRKPLTYQEQVMRRIEQKAGGGSLGDKVSQKQDALVSQDHLQRRVSQPARRIDPIDRTCNLFGRKIHKVMPRGEYKDWPFEEIPTKYIRWCLENWEDTDGLIETLQEEFRSRPDGY